MTEKDLRDLEEDIERTREKRPDIMQFYYDVKSLGPDAVSMATEILTAKKRR